MEAVLITGGSSGLGAAVAGAVRKEGGRPLIVDRQRPADGLDWVECDLGDTRAAEDATRRAIELAGQVNVTLLIPGGMRTRFFDDRDEQYKPGPDASLNEPADTAAAVVFALSQPPGCSVRELVVASERETSYP
jgi:NADP-dependent 3-hydroxy acid dehydrogenase YdfG